MGKETELTEKATLAHFSFELGSLRKIPRSHMQTLLTTDLSDNIASHSFRVGWISYFVACLEHADAYKAMLMGMMHDLGESRSGDQNWVHKRYVKVCEDEITTSQLEPLPNSQHLLSLAAEYAERLTAEAIIVKDADHLDQILLLKEYQQQGNREATRWLESKRHLEALKTASARRLGEEIYKQDPSEWWKSIWTDQRRK